MTDHEIETEFWRLCDQVNQADTLTSGVPDLEPLLLEILNFIKRHQEHRETFIDCFCKIVSGARVCSEWVILFCMRELRYAEVQAALNKRFDLLGGINTGAGARLMNFVSHVNWVYEDAPWEDAIFFKYYWDKESPNEPWPIADQSRST